MTQNLTERYSEQTSISRTFPIQKGQLNNYRFRQAILNEHVETARTVQGTVSAGNIVGQIFKASHDNINGLMITLESAAGTSFDNFESYADDAALQTAWVESGLVPAVLETTIVHMGTQSMEIDANAALNDEWIRTIGATDYTDFTFSLDLFQDIGPAFATLDFFIGDVTNTKSISLTVQAANEWTHFDINENVLSEDGGVVNTAAITRIGFRLTDTFPVASFYIDDMVFTPDPGSVNIKLFDMGATLPVSTVTALSDGTQYTQLGDLGLNGGDVVSEVPINIIGGKREYWVQKFIAGTALEIPSNQLLTVGNYYAFTINYVDTDIDVYGSNPEFLNTYYNNGYAFTAPDESTAITQIGPYNDIHFGIFSTQDAYVNTLIKNYDAAPGAYARENIRIENKNMKVEGIIIQNNKPPQSIIAEFKDRTYFFPKGGKFEINHSDDFSDSTSQIDITIGYIYEPSDVNG